MVSLAIHQVSNTVDVNSRNIYFLRLPPDKQNFSVQRLLVKNHLAVRHLAYTMCGRNSSATGLSQCVSLCSMCQANVYCSIAFWPKVVKLDFAAQVPSHLAVRHLAYTMCCWHSSATSLLVNACLCAVCVRQMSIAKMLFDQKLWN